MNQLLREKKRQEFERVKHITADDINSYSEEQLVKFLTSAASRLPLKTDYPDLDDEDRLKRLRISLKKHFTELRKDFNPQSSGAKDGKKNKKQSKNASPKKSTAASSSSSKKQSKKNHKKDSKPKNVVVTIDEKEDDDDFQQEAKVKSKKRKLVDASSINHKMRYIYTLYQSYIYIYITNIIQRTGSKEEKTSYQ